MKRIRVGGAFEASAVSLGLWRVGKMTQREVDELVLAAYESGVDFFDTADIYAGGRSEELLGAAVRDLGLRDKVRIQTKAAILRDFLGEASELASRSMRSEIKIKSTVNVAEKRKEVDALSQEIRLLDSRIQQRNWLADLL